MRHPSSYSSANGAWSNPPPPPPSVTSCNNGAPSATDRHGLPSHPLTFKIDTRQATARPNAYRLAYANVFTHILLLTSPVLNESSPPLTFPSPFALHSAALDYAGLHPSLQPFTLPPFTLHSAALHPSPPTLHLRPALCRSSPFPPPPFTPIVHSAARNSRPSLCRPSPFIPPLFSPHSRTLQSRSSLRCSSPFIPAGFTLPSPTLHSRVSLRPPSLPPFTLSPVALDFRPSLSPFTLALHFAALHPHPSFRLTDNLPSLSPAHPTGREQLTPIISSWTCSSPP
jgi:hypothetical protein